MRFSVIASALVAAVVGFGGTLAIIVQAARTVGATPAQTASWVTSLCLTIAFSSLLLSWVFRAPIVTAWSLAGAVLVIATGGSVDLPSAEGAFALAGLLVVLAGCIPALGRAIARIPGPVAAAMLAGLMLRFVLGLFAQAQTAPALVLPLVALFLAARLAHAASATLVVIAAGLVLAPALGMAVPLPALSFSTLEWVTPHFPARAMIGLGLPLFLVTMATQNLAGFAVLRVCGYDAPVRPILLVTGLMTMLGAPFAGHSCNLASVTAAICTGPEAHPDPVRRWLTGPVYAACYGVLALFGASLVTLFANLPPPLVATVTGVALLGPLTGALTAAMAVERERFAAMIAFAVTGSGVALLGVGAAFWGLLAGLVVLGLDRVAHAARRPGRTR